MLEQDSKISLNFADSVSYDRRIRRFVPYYDEMMDLILACAQERNGFEILELGCGTGSFSHRVLDTFPRARLTAIDLVQEMVDCCRNRLADSAGRAEVIQADLINFSQPRSFDCVLSNLALHYPETDAKKIRACWNVFESLRSGGCLCFSVMLAGPTDEHTQAMWRAWEEDVLMNGVAREEIEQWYRVYHPYDYPVPPGAWLKWLGDVGFDDCRLVWFRSVFGAIQAHKTQAVVAESGAKPARLFAPQPPLEIR